MMIWFIMFDVEFVMLPVVRDLRVFADEQNSCAPTFPVISIGNPRHVFLYILIVIFVVGLNICMCIKVKKIDVRCDWSVYMYV